MFEPLNTLRRLSSYLLAGTARAVAQSSVGDAQIEPAPCDGAVENGAHEMRQLLLIAFAVWGALSWAQDVHVTEGKGSITLSVSAQQGYDMMSGQKKKPVLSVECALKGKKTTHLVMFSAEGTFADDSPESAPRNRAITLDIDLGGAKQATSWIPYGDAVTYAYYGKTEPERAKFLQLLLASSTLSVEFTPFLTGVPTKSTFDLSKLHDQVNSHPECAFN
jgi:hypothetical protein